MFGGWGWGFSMGDEDGGEGCYMAIPTPSPEPYPLVEPSCMRLTAYALGGIFKMKREVEYTDDFGMWWETLEAAEQDSIDVVVRILEE
jgi:hypothetical protein